MTILSVISICISCVSIGMSIAVIVNAIGRWWK